MDPTTLSQLYGALRVLVPAAVAAGAALGWVSSSDASALTSELATAGTAGAALITAGATIWSIFSHSKSATIAAAAQVPGVKAVVADPSIANNSTFAANPKVITQAQASEQTQGLTQGPLS